MKSSKYIYTKRKRRITFRPLPRLLIILAVLVLLTGLAVSAYDWRINNSANKHAAAAVAQANQGINNGVPSTNPISTNTFANYHVPANQPRYVFIPKLNVEAIVLSLGITNLNQIQAPPNIYEAGWYRQSGLPGQKGTMLIDGHVSSWTAHGIFYGLKTLVAGDGIQVERGDGTLLNYKVVKTQIYSSTGVDMTALLSPINTSKPGLNLITCTGDVIAGTNEFNERIAVFAEQV